MRMTTTSTLDGHKVSRYLGVVTGEAILGANIFRDFFAGIRDIVGGRSGSYEKVLRDPKDTAMREMMEHAKRLGDNAVIGVDRNYETVQVGNGGGMPMVSASGTAVVLDNA